MLVWGSLCGPYPVWAALMAGGCLLVGLGWRRREGLVVSAFSVGTFILLEEELEQGSCVSRRAGPEILQTVLPLGACPLTCTEEGVEAGDGWLRPGPLGLTGLISSSCALLDGGGLSGRGGSRACGASALGPGVSFGAGCREAGGWTAGGVMGRLAMVCRDRCTWLPMGSWPPRSSWRPQPPSPPQAPSPGSTLPAPNYASPTPSHSKSSSP